MTREEAEEYADKMSYRDAVSNALMGKGIPFRKATLTKLHRLLDIIEPKEKETEFSELEMLRRFQNKAGVVISQLRADRDRLEGRLDKTLDEIIAEIQSLRGCSCGCSDGVVDDVEDIILKYKEKVKTDE